MARTGRPWPESCSTGHAQQPVRAQFGDRAVHNAVVVGCAMVLAREHVAASADRDAAGDDLAVDARAV
jgi:hypothetical protein